MVLGNELDHMFPVPSFWMSENVLCQSCSVHEAVQQVRESMYRGRGASMQVLQSQNKAVLP